MGHVNTREEVVEAFKVFDRQGRGTITAQELREALTDLGDFMDPNEVEELIYEADFDGNGNIRYEDFANMMFMWD